MENEKKPLITIIVPIYNDERYLEECVNSILNQDYTNLEVILVDDGSTDKSPEMLDKLLEKDGRIHVIHQENAGVSVARNTALNNVHGKYICLIDQDDYISSDYVSYFYNLIKENNAEIALTPQPYKVTQQNKEKEIKEINDYIEIWSGKKATKEMLYYNLVIAPWNKMISYDLIEKNNIRFNPSFFGGEGFSFSIDCFQRASKVVVGHKKIYNYRVDNPSSGMTKFSMRVIDSSIEAQKYIKNNLIEKTEELLKACRYANWHTYCDCLNTLIGCEVRKRYIEKYNEIKKVCQKDALCVIKAPISQKEKIKGILYFINPYFASKIINHFRLRKFTIESEGK